MSKTLLYFILWSTSTSKKSWIVLKVLTIVEAVNKGINWTDTTSEIIYFPLFFNKPRICFDHNKSKIFLNSFWHWKSVVSKAFKRLKKMAAAVLYYKFCSLSSVFKAGKIFRMHKYRTQNKDLWNSGAWFLIDFDISMWSILLPYKYLQKKLIKCQCLNNLFEQYCWSNNIMNKH